MSKSPSQSQIRSVTNFKDLVATPFAGNVNAICWERKLQGDFAEIANALTLNENMVELDQEELLSLRLSDQGRLARDILIDDMMRLKAHGASPVLNVIKSYERDDSYPLFPTDVYSFHVDRSPVPTDTFLCTYHGDSSEIIPNAHATQKVLIPEIRAELKQLHDGNEADFESFLTEYFFDLHYQANAKPTSLGIGHLWRLAVDHTESKVPPCIHRAPIENSGQRRLLLIC